MCEQILNTKQNQYKTRRGKQTSTAGEKIDVFFVIKKTQGGEKTSTNGLIGIPTQVCFLRGKQNLLPGPAWGLFFVGKRNLPTQRLPTPGVFAVEKGKLLLGLAWGRFLMREKQTDYGSKGNIHFFVFSRKII